MNANREKPHQGGERSRGGRLHPVEWAVEAGAMDDVVQEMERRIAGRRRGRLSALGAGVFTVFLAGWIWQAWAPPRAVEDLPAPASVVVNEPSRQVLDDGSVVELRSGAALQVAFSDQLRRVVLERGEAHFQVMKDAGRPFVVEARGLSVRAVGTAFAVVAHDGATEVLVTEGRVALETIGVGPRGEPALPERTPAGPPRAPDTLGFLDAGDRAVVDTVSPAREVSAQVAVVSAREMAERLAWRVPTLEFSATPLSEAVPMLNRHGNRRLVLADSTVGKVRLSGVLRGDNLDTLLRLLEEEHGIVARPTAGGEWVLTKLR